MPEREPATTQLTKWTAAEVEGRGGPSWVPIPLSPRLKMPPVGRFQPNQPHHSLTWLRLMVVLVATMLPFRSKLAPPMPHAR